MIHLEKFQNAFVLTLDFERIHRLVQQALQGGSRVAHAALRGGVQLLHEIFRADGLADNAAHEQRQDHTANHQQPVFEKQPTKLRVLNAADKAAPAPFPPHSPLPSFLVR